MYKLISTLILSVSSISANAICTQQNLAGTWHDYAITTVSVADCTFIIDSKGLLNQSSVCYNFTATSDLSPINVSAGYFKIDKSCNITGSLGANNGVNAFFKGQLDKSKASFTGISRNSTGNLALHNFVKE
jgi:hypothetical protein